MSDISVRNPNKRDLLLQVADLRAQLSAAREAIHELKAGKVAAPAAGERTSAASDAERYKVLGEEVKRPPQAEEYFRFYNVFVHAKAAMVMQDVDGRITEQNAAHRALLGYPDHELIGETLGYYLEGGRDEFGRTMDDLLQWGAYCGESRCRTSGGQWVVVELSSAIIRNPAGGISGYTTFMLDITEKRRIEGALRESEERFAAFMDNISAIAFMRDAKGRYAYVNKAFQKYIGKSSAEVLGKTAFDIWPAEIAQELATTDKQVLSSERPTELYEKTVLPGQGRKEWLAIKFPFHDRRGKAFVGCVSIDVTERKSLEEQLRQSQKMEAVGRLAGGIAHDFNNLLTIVLGYSELLLAASALDRGRRSKLEEIKKAGERASLLTRQLLAFSRKQVLAPRVLNLNGVVENLRTMIERLIGEDIEFGTLPYNGLDMVKADPGQVEQIIMNLVVNARDAMPEGGKLTIETANVEFDERYSRSHLPSVPGHYVMVSVSDAGTGMDAETQKHIFEPFFTTKEIGKGTGLGLATVYGIVKQSGGFIWVYSELGVGTVFKVYFPRVLEQEKVPVANPTATGPAKGTETILLAEDEEALRRLIRETLEEHGYRVLEASDGKDAIRLSESYRQPIDLLISDVVMPQMSGRELAERLTSARPETRVLFMSGYTDGAMIHHGVIGPGEDFLQKPFSPAALAEKVRLVLAHVQRSGAES